MTAAKPRFFRTPADFRKWLAANHASAAELLVGFHKVGSGKRSITWPQSVDEALCVGWIDGIRKRLDEHSYTIRFTPRRKGSTWSAINIRHVEALQAEKRMLPAGLEAFARRVDEKSRVYSYENRPVSLGPPYEGMLKKNKAAWAFFRSQPPSYRKLASWWVMSAKREETRLKRLAKLVEFSQSAKRL